MTLINSAVIAVIPDSIYTTCKEGDTLFAEFKFVQQRDDARKMEYKYLTLKRRFNFLEANVERILIYGKADVYTIPVAMSRNQLRRYTRFVTKLPKKKDSQGIYTDPVIRLMYQSNRYGRIE